MPGCVQEAESAIEKLRHQLFARGITGTSGLGRAFKTADMNGNKKLDADEFALALSFAGCHLTKAEVCTATGVCIRARAASEGVGPGVVAPAFAPMPIALSLGAYCRFVGHCCVALSRGA